jgi:hypothetical protein
LAHTPASVTFEDRTYTFEIFNGLEFLADICGLDGFFSVERGHLVFEEMELRCFTDVHELCIPTVVHFKKWSGVMHVGVFIDNP